VLSVTFEGEERESHTIQLLWTIQTCSP